MKDSSSNNLWGVYVRDRNYAKTPEHYVRAFNIIQSDFIKLLEYIEPSDINLRAYSYRTHELFMRSSIEVEANFKAILRENKFKPKINGKLRPENRWNIKDYYKVNKTHHLSAYKVHIPIWEGTNSSFEPFKDWRDTEKLSWYQSYNASKHDRQNKFKEANFENLINSIAGLLVLLSSQFGNEDFSTAQPCMAIAGTGASYYDTHPAIGDFFHIEFPNDWEESETYDFEWHKIKNDPDRFNTFDYNTL